MSSTKNAYQNCRDIYYDMGVGGGGRGGKDGQWGKKMKKRENCIENGIKGPNIASFLCLCKKPTASLYAGGKMLSQRERGRGVRND